MLSNVSHTALPFSNDGEVAPISPDAIRILVMAVSTRRDSYNRKLAHAVHDSVCEMWVGSTLLELSDYPLPLYNADFEAINGMPGNVLRLKEIIARHQGMIVISPEQNFSMPAVLKNTLDWVARPLPDQVGHQPFRRKPVSLMSASTSCPFGGQRGLRHIRDVLTGMGMHVLPHELSVSQAHKAFARNGTLRDMEVRGRIVEVTEELVRTSERLHR